jgi:hypothetical protein
LGVGKYTPNAAVLGDMGWKPIFVKQWGAVTRQYCRFLKMHDSRLNKKVFEWVKLSSNTRCKTGIFRIMEMYRNIGMFNIDNLHRCTKTVVDTLENKLLQIEIEKWKQTVNRVDSVRGNGCNKLRSYRLIKSHFVTEHYVKEPLPFHFRSAMAKFRCGVAPIRLETGRYENLNVHDRTCFNCLNCIEDEEHVLLKCPLYTSIREELYTQSRRVFNGFDNLSDKEKFCILFTDVNIVKYTAKACFNILKERKILLYCK